MLHHLQTNSEQLIRDRRGLISSMTESETHWILCE